MAQAKKVVRFILQDDLDKPEEKLNTVTEEEDNDSSSFISSIEDAQISSTEKKNVSTVDAQEILDADNEMSNANEKLSDEINVVDSSDYHSSSKDGDGDFDNEKVLKKKHVHQEVPKAEHEAIDTSLDMENIAGPNKALFDILHKSFSNTSIVQNEARTNLSEEDAVQLLQIIQLCFACFASTFATENDSNSSQNSSSFSRRNISLFSTTYNYNQSLIIPDAQRPSKTQSNLSANELVLLKQSPVPSQQQIQNKILSQQQKESLSKRPFVPMEIVYELWSEILQLSHEEQENKDDDERPKMEISRDQHELLKRMFKIPDAATTPEAYNEEKDAQQQQQQSIGNTSNFTNYKNTFAHKCCEYIRDVLVALGVLETITIAPPTERKQQNPTLQGISEEDEGEEEGGDNEILAMTSQCPIPNVVHQQTANNNNNDEADDNITIATGLSDYASTTGFSLFSTNKFHHSAHNLIHKKNEQAQVKIVFDTQISDKRRSSDDLEQNENYEKEVSTDLESDVKQVFFRINHDITQEYGAHLANTKFQKLITTTEQSVIDHKQIHDVSTPLSPITKISKLSSPMNLHDPSFEESPRIRWNKALVKALLHNENVPDVIIDLEESSSSIDDSNMDPDIEDTIMTDIYTMFALRMLPRHMVVASLYTEAAKLLRNSSFIKARLVSMGVLEGTLRHRDDCLDLQSAIEMKIVRQNAMLNTNTDDQQSHQDQSKKKDDNESYVIAVEEEENDESNQSHSLLKYAKEWSNRVIIQSYENVSSCLHISSESTLSSYKEHKQQLQQHDDEIAPPELYSKLAQELGQALHILGICYGEFSVYQKEMSHYQDAYKFKKTLLGERHVSVAETLYCIGAVHQSRGDSYRAMKCYQDALDIFVPLVGKDSLSVANVLHNAGVVYCDQNDYDVALETFEESLRVRRIKLGDNHEEISDTIQWIGRVHRELGDYETALKHFKAAHYGKEAKFGSKPSLAVAECLQNLGTIYDDLDDIEQSLSCYKKALKMRKQILEKDHDDVTDLLLCIGCVYRDIKKYGKALTIFREFIRLREAKVYNSLATSKKNDKDLSSLIECYEDVVNLTKTKMGNDHEDVANLYLQLGHIYDKTNYFDSAVNSYESALRIWRVNMDHLNTATVLNLLGVLTAKRNMFDQAMINFNEALYLRESKLGEDNLSVANILHNKGNAHAKNKEFDEAMECYERALKIRKANLGEDHITIARTLHNMGKICNSIGRDQQAMMCFSMALEIREVKLGKDNLEVAFTLVNIGKIHLKLKEYEKALEIFEESLRIRKLKFDDDHELIADSTHMIGRLYKDKGDYDKALQLLDSARWMYKRALGDDTLNLSYVLDDLGDIHSKRWNIVQMIDCFEKSLAIKTKFMDGNDPDLIETLRKLGLAHDRNSEFEESLSCYKSVLKVKKAEFGKDDLNVAALLHNVGVIQCKRKQFEVAIRCLEETLRIRKLLLGESHEVVADTLLSIGQVQQEMGELQEAKNLMYEAIEMYKLELGARDFKVASALNDLGALYKTKGENKKALKVFENSLALKAYNQDDEGVDKVKVGLDSAKTLRQIGSIHMMNNNYTMAKQHFDEALQIRRHHLHNYHDSVAESIYDCGLLFREQSDTEQALECFEKVLEIKKSNYGDLHVGLTEVMTDIGLLYEEAGDLDKAFSSYEEVMYIRKVKLGDDHIDIANIYKLLGQVQQKRLNYEEALQYMEGALSLFRSHIGPDDKCVAEMLQCMGSLYDEKDEKHEAMKYYKEALKMIKNQDSDDIDLISILQKIADIYKVRQEYDKVMKNLKEILRIQVKQFGNNHIETGETLFLMGNILCKSDGEDEALRYYDAVRSIRKKAYGSHSLEVAEVLFRMGKALDATGNYSKALQRYEASLSIYHGAEIGDDPVISALIKNIKKAKANLAKGEEF